MPALSLPACRAVVTGRRTARQLCHTRNQAFACAFAHARNLACRLADMTNSVTAGGLAKPLRLTNTSPNRRVAVPSTGGYGMATVIFLDTIRGWPFEEPKNNRVPTGPASAYGPRYDAGVPEEARGNMIAERRLERGCRAAIGDARRPGRAGAIRCGPRGWRHPSRYRSRCRPANTTHLNEVRSNG